MPRTRVLYVRRTFGEWCIRCRGRRTFRTNMSRHQSYHRYEIAWKNTCSAAHIASAQGLRTRNLSSQTTRTTAFAARERFFHLMRHIGFSGAGKNMSQGSTLTKKMNPQNAVQTKIQYVYENQARIMAALQSQRRLPSIFSSFRRQSCEMGTCTKRKSGCRLPRC